MRVFLIRTFLGVQNFFTVKFGTITKFISQLMKQIPMTFTEKLSVHFRDVFNVLDILGIVTYYAAFILKVAR